MTDTEIKSWLLEVVHPAKGSQNIIELGMVDSVSVEGNKVSVTLAFPKRRDPLTEYLVGATRATIIRNAPAGTEVEVKTIVKEEAPKKKPGLDLGLEELNNVRHIIGIASGKGGVGKSTVAVNLAVALARLGYRVGLADADVYGPSVPLMTGTENEVPAAEENGEGKEIILPIEKYGVKWMSIGYFAEPGQALIWRGPMACNALKQMILQVRNRHIFGLVENMAWFTPEELPENKYFIFGKDGGRKMAEKYGIPLLGQIPIVQSIREGGDSGEPSALSTRPDALAFLDLARTIAQAAG